MNARRFTAISVLVTLVGIGLFTWLLYGFPDRLVPTDPPPTVGEYALRCAVCVFSWPTVIIAWLFGEPGGHAIFLLFIPSGLVWAELVELFFKIRQPRRANPAAPGNGAIAHLLHFKRLRRAVPELIRYMKITHLSIVMATGACAMVIASMLVPALAPWLARESIFEFTAREPKNRNPAGAAPNGGPATPSGHSEVTDGPPSVS